MVNEHGCWLPFRTQSEICHSKDRQVLDPRTALSNQQKNCEKLCGTAIGWVLGRVQKCWDFPGAEAGNGRARSSTLAFSLASSSGHTSTFISLDPWFGQASSEKTVYNFQTNSGENGKQSPKRENRKEKPWKTT